MRSSMEDYLHLAVPHLAPDLVSPRTIARITHLARWFPPVACMFECHLGPPQPQADFLMRFILPDNSYALLAGDDPAFPPAGATPDSPVWSHLRAFCRHWADPAMGAYHAIEKIWLELDLNESPAELPLPSFFFDFAPLAEQRLAVSAQVLPILLGAPLPGGVGQQIARCVQELPSGAQLFSIGTMFSRQMAGMRVCISAVEPAAVLPYLDRIGWTGSRPDLEIALRKLAGFVGLVTLALDVGAQVFPKIGIEYHLEVADNLKNSPARWSPFLDRLIAEGLCAASKQAGLLAWIGYDHARAYAGSWPDHLQEQARIYGPDVLSLFARKLSHIKVVYGPDRPPEAKAYLELMHLWMRYNGTTQRAILQKLPDGA